VHRCIVTCGSDCIMGCMQCAIVDCFNDVETLSHIFVRFGMLRHNRLT
jgi:hypothetical protein